MRLRAWPRHRRVRLALSAAGVLAAGGPAFAQASAARRPIIVNALGGLENPNLALTRPP